MVIDIDVRDSIEPTLVKLLQTNAKYLRAVSKSVGWFVQKETKAGIKSGAPGGQPFEERIPYKIRKALSETAKHAWYGAMVNAVGYEYSNGSVNIGWTSKAAAAYGKIQEYGMLREVTSNMRKYWAAVGYPLSKNTEVLNVPERPVFEPMANVVEKQIPSYVEDKLNSYLQETADFGEKQVKRRKYKVYG